VEDATERQLRESEERLLNASGQDCEEIVRALLAEDFVEFASSGRVFNREQIVDAMRRTSRPDSTPRSLLDFKAVKLGADVALVTYRALRYEGREKREIRSLRSSIWKRDGGAWKMYFHQGTLTAGSPSNLLQGGAIEQ
jgi:hypothetical protein